MTLVSPAPPPFPSTLHLTFVGSLAGTPVSHSPHATTAWVKPQLKWCFTNTHHSGAELSLGAATGSRDCPLHFRQNLLLALYWQWKKGRSMRCSQDQGQGAGLGGCCGTMGDTDTTAPALPLRTNVIIQATVIKTKQQGIICIISPTFKWVSVLRPLSQLSPLVPLRKLYQNHGSLRGSPKWKQDGRRWALRINSYFIHQVHTDSALSSPACNTHTVPPLSSLIVQF